MEPKAARLHSTTLTEIMPGTETKNPTLNQLSTQAPWCCAFLRNMCRLPRVNWFHCALAIISVLIRIYFFWCVFLYSAAMFKYIYTNQVFTISVAINLSAVQFLRSALMHVLVSWYSVSAVRLRFQVLLGKMCVRNADVADLKHSCLLSNIHTL